MLLCVRSQVRCSSASQQKEVSGQSEQNMLQAPSDRGIFSFPVCHDQRIQTPPYVSRIFGSLLSSVELIGVSISNRTFRSYWYVVLPELSVVHVERQHPRYKHSISLLLWCAIHFFLFNNNRQLSCAVHIKKVCYIFFGEQIGDTGVRVAHCLQRRLLTKAVTSSRVPSQGLHIIQHIAQVTQNIGWRWWCRLSIDFGRPYGSLLIKNT